MKRYSGHFYGVEPLSARARYAKNLKKCSLSWESVSVIRIAVDTLSNTTKSEKTNKLIDDPERNVHYKMLLTNHNAGHMVKFV